MFEELSHSKIWENKQSPEFKNWIAQQAMLPSSEWSDDFRKYVDKKYEESQIKEKDEKSPEEELEAVRENYQQSLGLQDSDLFDRRVLDLGCLDGVYIRGLMEGNISKDVYGLDMELQGTARSDKEHFFTGSFTDKLPVNNLDYVVSVGAVSLYFDEENIYLAKSALEHSIHSLNNEGEIRIAPIGKAPEHNDLEGLKETERVVLKMMGELEAEFNIEWELQPTDISVSGTNRDVWLDQTLIIRKVGK